jgi:hypothetical protein
MATKRGKSYVEEVMKGIEGESKDVKIAILAEELEYWRDSAEEWFEAYAAASRKL